jgi:hypothetical protein
MRRFGSTTLATIRRSSRLTALLTWLPVAAHPAHAQIETVLYSLNFDGSYPHGAQPHDLLRRTARGRTIRRCCVRTDSVVCASVRQLRPLLPPSSMCPSC